MSSSISVNDVFKTNTSGMISVVADKGFGVFTVKFIDTGFVRDTRRQQILSGEVKDKSLVKCREVKDKYKLHKNDGSFFTVCKLVEALDYLVDKDINKLYRIRSGVAVKGHEVIEIERM